jgi:hypothetical protein
VAEGSETEEDVGSSPLLELGSSLELVGVELLHPVRQARSIATAVKRESTFFMFLIPPFSVFWLLSMPLAAIEAEWVSP